MPCSTNVLKKAAGCIVRVEESFFLLNPKHGGYKFLSVCMDSRLRKEAYIIAEKGLFHTRSTGQRF